MRTTGPVAVGGRVGVGVGVGFGVGGQVGFDVGDRFGFGFGGRVGSGVGGRVGFGVGGGVGGRVEDLVRVGGGIQMNTDSYLPFIGSSHDRTFAGKTTRIVTEQETMDPF